MPGYSLALYREILQTNSCREQKEALWTPWLTSSWSPVDSVQLNTSHSEPQWRAKLECLLSPRPREISLEIPAPPPVSCVCGTRTWLSKSLFSVSLDQEIPSLLKPIIIQSIVSKLGSSQVSEPVFPHRILQLETFLPIARERKECGWGIRASPRDLFSRSQCGESPHFPLWHPEAHHLISNLSASVVIWGSIA